MDEKDIRNELIKNQIITADGEYSWRKWKSRDMTELRASLAVLHVEGFDDVGQKIWFFINKLPRPKCAVCGSKTSFMSVSAGFKSTCSKMCAARSSERKHKIQKTSLDRYGTAHPTQSQKFRDTIATRNEELGFHPGGFNTPENRAGIFNKYGVDIASKSEAVKNKTRDTVRKRYGVDNPQQHKETRARTEASKMARYGNAWGNLAAAKESLIEKCGVEQPLKSKESREKAKNTSRERYGTDFPLQNAEVLERCHAALSQTRHGFKQLVLPSGDIRWVQGFEPQVIEYLLMAGVEEGDLKTHRPDIPPITYTVENSQRIYRSDIFIPSKNMLIEVKSTYSWGKDFLRTMAKHAAAKDSGFRHLIIIWDNSRNCIKEMIN